MFITFFVLGILQFVSTDLLPTNYEYYTSEVISSGLSAEQNFFLLNGKNFSIYSGSVHYFRVPRAYWRDRLRKVRAAGLNTIETYVAWNLHEPYSGVYDFGNGGSEMEDFLNLPEYLQIAKEEDLFVIMRIGPYICSEYNFGGFPSWLLREKKLKFRTNEATYMKYVERYFNVLLPVLKQYQFTNGGSIIAFQVENEYGYFVNVQKEYLTELRRILLGNGIIELLVTSDGPRNSHDRGTIPEYFLQTGNFGSSVEEELTKLEELQPNKPLMVMEYWIGWYDSWGNAHNSKSIETIVEEYKKILNFPSSVNIYMFHGGTNFAFSNGALLYNIFVDNSGFQPITTSYDYDSPLTEAGDYTDKYYKIKDLLKQYNLVKTVTPEVPELSPRIAYPSITIERQLSVNHLLEKNAQYIISSETVLAMELLDINNSSGQSSGYIVYRKENLDLEANSILKIEGHICDTVFVLLDGKLVSPILETSNDLNNFGYWRLENPSLILNSEIKKNVTMDLIVEEWGRMNEGSPSQYSHSLKGIWQGDVYLNDEKISNWKIIPLEFKRGWNENLKGWSNKISNLGSSLNLAILELSEEPKDTYLDMRNWSKGLVIVNGFPLGKYAIIGPQQALYLPAPFLKKGINHIIIFEHFKAAEAVVFSTDQIWSVV